METEKGLFFYGNVGTGKTTQIESSCKVYSVLDIQAEVLKRDDKGDINMQRNLLNFARSGMYIGLDDIGREKPISLYGYEFDVIREFINERYRITTREYPKMKTNFTSNLSINELVERYGIDAMDRLKQICNFKEFDGLSFRK